MSDDERYERELLENVNELRTFINNFKLTFKYSNCGIITTLKNDSMVLQRHYISSETRKVVLLDDFPNNYAHSKQFSKSLEVLRSLFLENIDIEFSPDDMMSIFLKDMPINLGCPSRVIPYYMLENTVLIIPVCAIYDTNEVFTHQLLHTIGELHEQSLEIIKERIEQKERTED